ncbi:MAG: hypothetical protein BAA01_00295 [Bacillus thermozeamaize]|uniref:Metallo-beta-lactamase domain-containing protein n=1 Tax=Bacillus thermozeamaize TaxID=230954 RepID=A0A1Y3PU53_9BACI|nr:MAG: hypothetical protein BAA01_00295 [Bacillus thermozeamaize]
MKVTIVGIWGAYPEAGAATTSFLLEEDGFCLLVECGSGVLSQVQQYAALSELDAVVLTHYHHDHAADLGCLQYGMMIQTLMGHRHKPLPIYGHAEDKKQFARLTYGKAPFTVGMALSDGETKPIGPWRVSACATMHEAYCLALKFQTPSGKTLVYTGDTGWSQAVVDFSQGADLLISEATLFDEQKGQAPGHLTAGQAGELAANAEAGRLLLIHFSHAGDLEKLRRQAQRPYGGLTELAQPGMTILL